MEYLNQDDIAFEFQELKRGDLLKNLPHLKIGQTVFIHETAAPNAGTLRVKVGYVARTFDGMLRFSVRRASNGYSLGYAVTRLKPKWL